MNPINPEPPQDPHRLTYVSLDSGVRADKLKAPRRKGFTVHGI